MFDFEVGDEAARKKILEEQRAMLGCYGVFVTNESAKRLLESWKKQSQSVIPIDAPIQAYAAKEFARRFIDIIENNIELLKRSGTSVDDNAHLR